MRCVCINVHGAFVIGTLYILVIPRACVDCICTHSSDVCCHDGRDQTRMWWLRTWKTFEAVNCSYNVVNLRTD